MNKKSWLIFLIVVLVAVGIYNSSFFLGPKTKCVTIDGKDCEGVLNPNPGTCTDEERKCDSTNGVNFICCPLEGYSCGSAEHDDSNNGQSNAWCVPTNPSCPKGTTVCRGVGNGVSTACCPSGFSCANYGESAWCKPDGDKSCPTGYNFIECGAIWTDSVCCSPEKTPGCWEGYAFCSDSDCVDVDSWFGTDCDQTDCPQGTTPCGDDDIFYCCASNEVCNTHTTIDYCSATSCLPGQELCSGTAQGYLMNICCPLGECVPSQNGPPTCTNTWQFLTQQNILLIIYYLL